MQLHQLAAEVVPGRSRAVAKIAHRRLRDAALLGDFHLRPPFGGQVGEQLLPVHSVASLHHNSDIRRYGKSIVNIGKLQPVKKDRTDFGRRMYAARKRAGLTQEQAATSVGAAQSSLAEMERTSNGSARTSAFARLYRCDPHWLATGEGEPDTGLSQQALAIAIRFDGAGPEEQALMLRVFEIDVETTRPADLPPIETFYGDL